MFDIYKMQADGYDNTQWYKYYQLSGRIGNLELLTQQENQEKLNKPFDQWIATRDPSFRKRHLIPEDPELWKFENFERFIDARQLLIVDRLYDLFGSTAGGEIGQ